VSISVGARHYERERRQYAGIHRDSELRQLDHLDITTQVTWSSSNIAVAQVSNAAGSNGVATSLTAGTATITATYSGANGTATLTVSAPALVSITVTPATATISAGDTRVPDHRRVPEWDDHHDPNRRDLAVVDDHRGHHPR